MQSACLASGPLRVYDDDVSGRRTACCCETGGRVTVGLDDKIENAAEKLGGKGKEAAGRASDDPGLTAEGQADQSKADLKQAGEKVKDAFKKD
jgi:uncharacterized protein YjbJ (UPF0337 family)